jgi:hypothetical protein
MKNKISNVIKLSGFIVAVASVNAAAFAQGAAPQVSAPARPSAGTVSGVQNLTTVIEGRPLNVIVQNTVSTYAIRAKLDASRSSALQTRFAASLAKMEKDGVKITPAIAEATFVSTVNEVIGKQADAAGANQIASAAFASAMSAKTSATDVASSIVSSVTGTGDTTSDLDCSLLSSMSSGNPVDGMASNKVDVADAAEIANLRSKALTTAGLLDRHFVGSESVEVSSYAEVSGKPAVTAKANNPRGAVDIFTSAASKNADSVAVLEGLNGVLDVAVEVSNGIGKDANGSTYVGLVWGAVEQRLTSSVGPEQAATIVYGPLADLNGDGKIDAADRGERQGGLADHCSTAVFGKRP